MTPRVETCCNFKPTIKVVLTEIYMLFIIDLMWIPVYQTLEYLEMLKNNLQKATQNLQLYLWKLLVECVNSY